MLLSSYEDNPKLRKDTREFVLKPIEGQKKLNASGMVDNRLFSGENNLIAVRDPQTSLWSLRYKNGIMQQALKGQFTNFHSAKTTVEEYFKKRGVSVSEVLD